MDYLKELWDLYELNFQDKPELQPDPEPSAIDTPTDTSLEHPIIQQRNRVDDLRQQGVEDTDAHQEVHGDVDLSDPKSKADLASTLARIQQDSAKRGVKTEDDADFKSLLARDKEAEHQNEVTPNDLKTPQPQEVPDSLEMQQDECYNFDIMYLQTYGRA